MPVFSGKGSFLIFSHMIHAFEDVFLHLDCWGPAQCGLSPRGSPTTFWGVVGLLRASVTPTRSAVWLWLRVRSWFGEILWKGFGDFIIYKRANKHSQKFFSPRKKEKEKRELRASFFFEPIAKTRIWKTEGSSSGVWSYWMMGTPL